MRQAWFVQAVAFFVLLSPPQSRAIYGADTAQNPGAKLPSAIRAWDTKQASAEPLAPSALANRDEWIEIPMQKTAASFQGDAVMTNGRVLAVQRKQSSATEVYSVGAAGAVARLRLILLAADGQSAFHLDRV